MLFRSLNFTSPAPLPRSSSDIAFSLATTAPRHTTADMSANVQGTMRKRAPPQGDEEAGAELKLGEFQNVQSLTHSEASLVLNALVTNRRRDKDNKRGESE